MEKFRKIKSLSPDQPLIVEAVQWDGYVERFQEWIDRFKGLPFTIVDIGPNCGIEIDTPVGKMTARPGDWILLMPGGGFYPCEGNVFAMLYDAENE
jgi:hypothetical protein